jgi:hypothetical protein
MMQTQLSQQLDSNQMTYIDQLVSKETMLTSSK